MSHYPNTNRDEEIARGLQIESGAATAVTPDATFASVDTPQIVTAGVELPPPSHLTEEVGTSLPSSHSSVVADSSDVRASALLLQKMVFLVKSIAIASFLYWTFSVVFRAWFFVFTLGIVFCPLGWIGAHKRSRLLSAVFCWYLLASIVLEAVFPFAYVYDLSALAIIICVSLVCLMIFAGYVVWRFTRMLAATSPSQLLANDPLL